MKTEQLDPSRPSAAGPSTTDLGEAVVRRAHIFAVPASQRYYWTDEWQAGEQETLQSLRGGQGIRFASGQEFAEWLRSGADDDEPNAGSPDGD